MRRDTTIEATVELKEKTRVMYPAETTDWFCTMRR
jgi:hypothetical protein